MAARPPTHPPARPLGCCPQVRMDRDPTTCQSVTMPGLFPAGEGAGYAGGIMSAAVDGLRVGEAVAAHLLALAD